MRRLIFLLLVLVCAFSGYSQVNNGKRLLSAKRSTAGAVVDAPTQRSASVSSLPIRRVILYSNGVAYIERRGMVSGNAEVNLSFKQSQVDDVLKSMLVLDMNQGKIGAVSYNSSAPASARTAEIPFSVEAESGIEGTGGLANVLTQMQGARVSVASSAAAAVGSILTVEKRAVPAEKDRPASTRYFLVIASDNGEISSFDLSEVRSVKILDEGTKRDLNEFASATASTRRRDAKTITVTSNGTGQREMVVSYTVAAPIWKTTYRVVLDEEGRPFFQGWAIVDNVSEEDWDEVKLSLVSGSPVSFIQNLQKPLYRYRPIIPIPDDLNLDPQVYDPEGTGVGSGSGSAGGLGSGNGNGSGTSVSETVDVSSAQNNIMSVQTSISDALISESAGIQTAASGSEIGDLFEYKITNPVTVSRNRSALIPIVQTKMEGERVSIYNESTRKDRPMGGMMLTKTTPLTFEGGSMTVLDRDAYAGEALMERLKPKERRLISFALDLGTRISTETEADDRPAQLIKVVDGVFQVHYFKAEKKKYKITNQTDREKILYVEHPVRQGWALSDDSARPDILTNMFYGFRLALKPFENREMNIIERQALMDSYQLGRITSEQLKLFVTRRYIDEATRARLERLIVIRQQIHQHDSRIEAFDKEVQRIEEDQKRLRENIESLAKTAEAKSLIARYIAKANDQETRLEEMEKERKAISAEKEKLERELAAAITAFEIK
jgi:archaellum component FlaC